MYLELGIPVGTLQHSPRLLDDLKGPPGSETKQSGKGKGKQGKGKGRKETTLKLIASYGLSKNENKSSLCIVKTHTLNAGHGSGFESFETITQLYSVTPADLVVVRQGLWSLSLCKTCGGLWRQTLTCSRSVCLVYDTQRSPSDLRRNCYTGARRFDGEDSTAAAPRVTQCRRSRLHALLALNQHSRPPCCLYQTDDHRQVALSRLEWLS